MGLGVIFSRIGGKNYLKKKIYEFFPDESTYTTYVEPFIGGGSMYLLKDPSPKEVINDLDKGVASVYKGIKSLPAETIKNMNFDIDNKEYFLK